MNDEIVEITEIVLKAFEHLDQRADLDRIEKAVKKFDEIPQFFAIETKPVQRSGGRVGSDGAGTFPHLAIRVPDTLSSHIHDGFSGHLLETNFRS